jgi:hypothetical protein
VTDQQRFFIALLFFVIAAVALVWGAIFGGSAFDGGGTDSPQQQTCPDELRVIAEPRGGFVRGVDLEYNESMDWDGDGISCE